MAQKSSNDIEQNIDDRYEKEPMIKFKDMIADEIIMHRLEHTTINETLQKKAIKSAVFILIMIVLNCMLMYSIDTSVKSMHMYGIDKVFDEYVDTCNALTDENMCTVHNTNTNTSSTKNEKVPRYCQYCTNTSTITQKSKIQNNEITNISDDPSMFFSTTTLTTHVYCNNMLPTVYDCKIHKNELFSMMYVYETIPMNIRYGLSFNCANDFFKQEHVFSCDVKKNENGSPSNTGVALPEAVMALLIATYIIAIPCMLGIILTFIVRQIIGMIDPKKRQKILIEMRMKEFILLCFYESVNKFFLIVFFASVIIMDKCIENYYI